MEVDTEKDKFVVVELWELQRIFAEANKPFKVFDFFLNLVGTINNTTKEWHMSQDEMVMYWGYGKETINSYLEQLENMQLIYVYRHNKRRSDGTYHKINNSYGRYSDKDLIIAEAQKYAGTVECEKVDHWGEPDPLEHDFTVEEMFEMPIVSDLQSEGSNIMFTHIESEEVFA